MQVRGVFSSRLGFVLAAAGSAVGLGNIWKFPYVAGSEGGGAFLIIYLALVFSIGSSIMLAEFAVGRASLRNPVGAYKKLRGGLWPLAGLLGVVAGFLILSFYSVVGGWTLAYLFQAVQGALPKATDDLATHFSTTISDPLQPIVFHALFMGLCLSIVLAGVNQGIERANKVLMPILLILLIILVLRSVTLEGAAAGIAFFLKPDFSKITADMINAALAQAFFSLSLGMGALITYGSYLDRRENLPKAALLVTSLDTMVALMAGFLILPAVFAFGVDPAAGPGLTFITLPAIFSALPFGGLFAMMFFALLAIAALTSAISLLEVVVAYMIDEHGIARKRASLLCGILIFILGIPASLAFGPWSDITLGGKTIFDIFDYIATNIILPLGGILISIFVGWTIKKRALDEVRQGHITRFILAPVWIMVLRFVAPVTIAWILISGL